MGQYKVASSRDILIAHGIKLDSTKLSLPEASDRAVRGTGFGCVMRDAAKLEIQIYLSTGTATATLLMKLIATRKAAVEKNFIVTVIVFRRALP